MPLEECSENLRTGTPMRRFSEHSSLFFNERHAQVFAAAGGGQEERKLGTPQTPPGALPLNPVENNLHIRLIKIRGFNSRALLLNGAQALRVKFQAPIIGVDTILLD